MTERPSVSICRMNVLVKTSHVLLVNGDVSPKMNVFHHLGDATVIEIVLTVVMKRDVNGEESV